MDFLFRQRAGGVVRQTTLSAESVSGSYPRYLFLLVNHASIEEYIPRSMQ